MKSLLTTLTTIMAFGLLVFSAPVLAQTPDGDTPAQETVCDPLKVDGVTNGLYGLCVAFCEAQDLADENTPITALELLDLEDDAPSGRILANYNKKRDKANNMADPEMPCILVEEPCPCWTAAELDSIPNPVCDSSNSINIRILDSTNVRHRAVSLSGSRMGCRYFDNTVSPIITRILEVRRNTLTDEEYLTCKIDLLEQAADVCP